MKWLVVAVVVLGFFAPPCRGIAEPRSALVVGVASADAPGTGGDADSVATVLSSLGFQVIHENNVSQQRMQALLVQFKALLARGGTGVFYYAGHGAQINNVNYLMPQGGQLTSLADVKAQWVNLDDIIGALAQSPASVRMVFLDACRDNPLLTQFSTQQTVDAYLPGLAKPATIAHGMLISFATSPNSIAVAGSGGRDDWYTAGFAKFVTQAGLGTDALMQRIGDYVDVASDGSQVPWSETSLRATYYFRQPVYIYAHLDSIDDEMILLVNGDEGLVSGGQVAAQAIALHVGPNRMIAQVYNQRTFTGGVEGLGGHLAEGWNYTLRFTDVQGKNVGPTLSGREDRPVADGPHHGHIFTVATGVIYVDEVTGDLTLRDLDPAAWQH